MNDLASVLVSKDMSTDVVVPPSYSSESPVTPPLPSDLAACHALIAELLDALKKAHHDCDGLRHRLDQLLRRLYGPKAERFDPNQPWLLPELAAIWWFAQARRAPDAPQAISPAA